ncbi:MFS transporter [Streptomyces sp. NPDC058155]|uniref:MFS transporter n=1 Tax=Streptomyces sp. NPDC058155 TaxID=3346359 RepID=UPI0036E945D1
MGGGHTRPTRPSEGSVVRPTSGYLAVARTSGVPRGLLAVFTSRLAGGIVPFSTIVACSQAYGGFAYAGAATATFMLSGALLAPARGRLVDRHGWRTLLWTALAYATLLTAAATAIGQTPAWTVLLALAAGGGAAAPIGPAVRTRWSQLVTDKQALQQAHALDSILEELTFVVAPLLTTAALLFLPARYCIAIGGWLPMLGVALLYRSATTTSTTTAAKAVSAAQRRPSRGNRSLIWSAEGQGIITPLIGLGLIGGALNVLLPATAAESGHITSAGYLFALFSAGGVIGGLAYGKIRWNLSLRTRYLAAGITLAGATALLAPAMGTLAALPAILLVGIPLTPLFVIGYLLVDERLSHRQTEANAWLGSSYNLGSAGGAALCGWLLTQAAPRSIALCLALFAALGALCALRLSPRPSAHRDTETAPHNSPHGDSTKPTDHRIKI